MSALIAIALALFVLVSLLGLPYQQSWYHRWGGWDQ